MFKKGNIVTLKDGEFDKLTRIHDKHGNIELNPCGEIILPSGKTTKSYYSHNIIEVFGGNRYSKFLVDGMFVSEVIVTVIGGKEAKFSIEKDRLVSLDEDREKKLQELGI
jgi:hypothetical protein